MPAESSVSVGGGKTVDPYGQLTPQFLNAVSTAALKAAKEGPPTGGGEGESRDVGSGPGERCPSRHRRWHR